jgi:hypothetical protein
VSRSGIKTRKVNSVGARAVQDFGTKISWAKARARLPGGKEGSASPAILFSLVPGDAVDEGGGRASKSRDA